MNEERKKEIEQAVNDINKIVQDKKLSVNVVHTVTFGGLEMNQKTNESHKENTESVVA